MSVDLCPEQLVANALALTHPSNSHRGRLDQVIASLEGRYGRGDYENTWRRITGGVVPDFATEQTVVQELARRLVDLEAQRREAAHAEMVRLYRERVA